MRQGNIVTSRSPRATAKHDELLDDLERALRRGNDRKRVGDDMDGIEQAMKNAISGGGGSGGKGSRDDSVPADLLHPNRDRGQILAPLGQIVEPRLIAGSPSASSAASAHLNSSFSSNTSAAKSEAPELRVPSVPYAVSPASSSSAASSASSSTKGVKSSTMDSSQAAVSSPQLRAVLLRCGCEVITPMLSTPGTFVITSDELRFVVNVDELRRRQDKEDASSARPKTGTGSGDSRSQRGVDKSKLLHHARSRTWKVSALTQMEFRRYQLQNIALEFFFESANAVFVNFSKSAVRNQVSGCFWLSC